MIELTDLTTTIAHHSAAKVQANGIEIVYDSFGDKTQPPMLLVNGLGTQMVGWDDDFCQHLAAHGFWVIRYDNRDTGLSTSFDAAGLPNLMALFQGESVPVPYLLRDMAADGVALLAALGIGPTLRREQAHVLGVSMGGMIVQEMLIHFPERLLTAVSIMSTTGNPDLPEPTPEAMAVLMAPPAADRATYLEREVAAWKVIGSPGYPFNEQRIRARAGRVFDRGLNPAGTARQMAAVLASGSRKEALQHVRVPTLVIHGQADPLVRVEGGIDTAAAIPNADLLLIDGMGHSIPELLWPQIMGRVAAHTKKKS